MNGQLDLSLLSGMCLLCKVTITKYSSHWFSDCYVLPKDEIANACVDTVTYPVSTSIDTVQAKAEVSKYFQTLVDQVRKATKYKKEHCIEALHSLSCFHVYPKCVCKGSQNVCLTS